MRQKVHDILVAWAPLDALIDDRVLEASAIDKHVKLPFVGVRMHTGFPTRPAIGGRQYVQVWAYDHPGSYLRIDSILIECRRALEAYVPVAGDPVRLLEARWIETGVDLRDDKVEAITRYSRFQLTQALRELYP